MQDNQNQTHWAYIAGVMDSDGCFMMSKHLRKTKNKTTERAIVFPKNVEKWSITYLATIKICQIEPEAIQFITDEMKYGSYNIDGARKSRPNSKNIYHWRITKPGIIAEFIYNLLPYLKIKKDRAEFLMKYCERQAKYKCPAYKGLSKEELDYREQAYRKMREFNGNKVGATTKSQGSERACDSLSS